MAILTQNTKMKKTSDHFGVTVKNFNIPAYKTQQGKVTCPFADKCVKFCYAQKGNYVRFAHNVTPHLEANYKLTRQDDFVFIMDKKIKRANKLDYIRIHDSGDFYSPEYRDKWFEIARRNPDKRFYAYTKSFSLFIEVDIPENFDIIFSEGSKLDNKVDLKSHRHALIFQDENDIEKQGYVNASNYDLYATKWFNKSGKVGIKYH